MKMKIMFLTRLAGELREIEPSLRAADEPALARWMAALALETELRIQLLRMQMASNQARETWV